jgi:predicted ATPase
LFEVVDLGLHELSGFAAPQRAWRILRESGLHSRFEALRSGDLPLIGRAEELALLQRRWSEAKSGEGRVVLLCGEPGIGKSRLSAAFAEHLRAEPHFYLQYFWSPYHQGSALFPVISEIERTAGYARDDAHDTKLDKLAALVSASAPPEGDGDVALFAELLSLPGSECYPPLILARNARSKGRSRRCCVGWRTSRGSSRW